MILMGWGGASGATPIAGIFIFGAMLLVFGFIFEWIMGNFFSMMSMGLFATFWLSFALLQLPTLDLSAPYITEADPTGTGSKAFNAGLALYLIVWGFIIFSFAFFSLKTNVAFAAIYIILIAFAFVMSGCYWRLSNGDVPGAVTLQKTGGALLFAVAVIGWYLTMVIVAGEMRVNLPLPVGDLSRFWPDSNKDLADEKRD